MLTKKQHELLLFIHKHLQKHGVSPSFDEKKAALELKSKSGIHRLITGLEERGFIRRLPHRARALEIVRLPENAESAGLGSKNGFSPKVINNDEYAPPPATATSTPTTPLVLMITAAARANGASVAMSAAAWISASKPRSSIA